MIEHNSFIKSTEPVDERFEVLKQLYPEIFSDGKINLDAFKDVTHTSELPEGQDKTPGYYGLYWPGKRTAKQLARKEAEGTLEPVPGDGVDEENTHNLYIEGDNLEVLRILKKSYKSRVKMIYIDPPYNTGNDFIYPDDYKMPVEEYLKMTGQADENGKKLTSNPKSSGAFHTNWLNMMYPRLQLARELLTEDGVIFISIDDNEQANLKLLCDDVFGEENFVYELSVVNNLNGNDNSSGMMETQEACLIYAKNKEKFVMGVLSLEEDEANDWQKDELGFWKEGRCLKATGINAPRESRPNLFFPIYINEQTLEFTLDEKVGAGWYHLIPLTDGKEMRWYWSKETFIKDKNEVIVKKTSDGYSLYKKQRPALGDLPSKRGKTTFYSHKYANANSNSEVKQLFNGRKVFDYTKSTYLIKDLISLANTDKDSYIFDFFSGSATTAHAVMQLNAEDGGNRKFIMVQLPHSTEESSEAFKAGYKTICEIGKERIRRAGKKILEEAKSKDGMFAQEQNIDIGFKVYRLTKSNFKSYTPVLGQDQAAKDTLFKELEGSLVPLVDGWKADNVLTQIILRQGFALDCTKEKLSSFTKNTVYKLTDSFDAVRRTTVIYVCLDSHIEEETIKVLTIGEGEKFICLDSAIDDSSYARLSDKGRIETI